MAKKVLRAPTIVIDGAPHAMYSYNDDTGYGLTECGQRISPSDVGGGLEDPVKCGGCAAAIRARQSASTKVQVPKFSLQPTETFPDGAPQRESYHADEFFTAACIVYAEEWRRKYAHPGRCDDIACPQCEIGRPVR